MTDNDYDVQKEIAISAWNTAVAISQEIETKYSQRKKECKERFGAALNSMVVHLIQNEKAESVNNALSIITLDLQDRCDKFPKTLRGLSNHLTDETREFLQKRLAKTQLSFRNEDTEESSSDVSESVETSDSTGEQTILEAPTVLSDLEIFQNTGYYPRPYDVWNFQMDDRFGLRHPGNIPAGIVFNTLYFFTNVGDLVFDPMAGGGVLGDCCKEVNRRYVMFDVSPTREDIAKHDITKGIPEAAKNADLMFWDPPYYKKMQADYGPNSISSLNKNDYLAVFKKVVGDAYKAGIKKIAFLMSNYDDEYNDITGDSNVFLWDYIAAITQTGNWRVHREIQCPLSTQQINAHQITPYIERKQIHRLTRSLVIFFRNNP